MVRWLWLLVGNRVCLRPCRAKHSFSPTTSRPDVLMRRSRLARSLARPNRPWIHGEGGKSQEYSDRSDRTGNQCPYSVIFTDKKLTLRIGSRDYCRDVL